MNLYRLHWHAFAIAAFLSISPHLCAAPVSVTNVTDTSIFVTIVCTKRGSRHMDLYIPKDQPDFRVDDLPVWWIPPGQTAKDVILPPWDAVHYDRNLWVSRSIKDLAQAMRQGRKTIGTRVTSFNVASSTAPRFIGASSNTSPLEIFSSLDQAESKFNRKVARTKSLVKREPQKQLLSEMLSYRGSR